MARGTESKSEAANAAPIVKRMDLLIISPSIVINDATYDLASVIVHNGDSPSTGNHQSLAAD